MRSVKGLKINLVVFDATDGVGIFDRTHGFQSSDVVFRQTVLTGTFDDESLISGVRDQLRIDVRPFSRIHENSMFSSVQVKDRDQLFAVTVAQTLVSVQVWLFCRIDLKNNAPNDVHLLPGKVRVAFAGVISAAFMEPKRVVQQFGDANGHRGGYAPF